MENGERVNEGSCGHQIISDHFKCSLRLLPYLAFPYLLRYLVDGSGHRLRYQASMRWTVVLEG